MPSANRRVHVTLSKQLSFFLQKIAIRDDVPEATKARELLERALELEEDAYFTAQAERLEDRTSKWIGHKAFWSRLA